MSRLTPARYVTAALILAASVVFLLHIHLAPRKPEFRSAQKATPVVQAKNGSGSGVVIRRTNTYGQPRLFVWTAAHVVDEDNVLKIEQRVRNEFRKVGNVTFNAKVVLRVPEKDVALLWLDAPDGYFDYVKFDEVGQRDIGAPVYHVGNFLGGDSFDASVSWGRISQLGVKPTSAWPWENVDQADMVILPGSSGGGLFSSDSRKVIGIVVGWPRMPGVAFYIPLRIMHDATRDKGYGWALFGDWCPDDSLLDKAVKTFTVVPKKDEPVIVITVKETPKKAPPIPRRFKGW